MISTMDKQLATSNGILNFVSSSALTILFFFHQIFLVTFLAAELPSGLISKRVGADNWIPFIMMSWSITAMCQAFLHSRSAYFAIKALLGLLMGGFIPYELLIDVRNAMANVQ
jgi:hypothetical protein